MELRKFIVIGVLIKMDFCIDARVVIFTINVNNGDFWGCENDCFVFFSTKLFVVRNGRDYISKIKQLFGAFTKINAVVDAAMKKGRHSPEKKEKKLSMKIYFAFKIQSRNYFFASLVLSQTTFKCNLKSF